MKAKGKNQKDLEEALLLPLLLLTLDHHYPPTAITPVGEGQGQEPEGLGGGDEDGGDQRGGGAGLFGRPL